MTFGKYLERCIKKRDISVANLTKMSGINRGKLYYVFDGKRKLTDEELFLLIDKAGFSKAEADNLVDLYFEELYDKTEFSRIKFLEKAIQRDNYTGESSELNLNADNFTDSMDSKEQLINSIAYLFFHDKEIISNFSFRDKEIDNAVFECMMKTQTKLTHIMEFSTDETAEENFERIFSSMKYMYNNSFPIYRYTNTSLMKYENMFYYYFVGEKYAILYNDKNGIFIDNADAVSCIRENASEIADKATPLGVRTEDIMYIKSLYDRSAKQTRSEAVDITYYPCFAGVFDYDFINSVIKAEFPGREMLIDVTVKYYDKTYSKQNYKIITTTKGFEKFVNEGCMQEAFESFCGVASKSERIRLLKKLITNIETGKLYIFDDDKVNMYPGLEIVLHFEKLILNGYDIEKENFCSADKFTVHLDDQSLMNTLSNFKDYIIRSRKVYPKEYSIKFIEDLIVKLEHMDID